MSDGFNDVPAFVAVVEAGGFSAAARRLNVSRSAVGKAVSRLEGRLSVRLFHRTTRRQSLTDEGQAFYECCQQALSALQAGKALLESGRKMVSGKLRISMPVLFGRLCIAPLLMKLAAAHSELELELNFRDRHVDLVEDGFDLAIRNGPIVDTPHYIARRIARERILVCASPSYIATHERVRKLSDLTSHQAVTYSRNGRMMIWKFPSDKAGDEDLTPPTRLRFDDLGALLDAAVAGFGIAWLPDWLIREKLHDGELVHLLPDIPARVTGIYAIWPKTSHLPMRVRVAIDALVAGFE